MKIAVVTCAAQEDKHAKRWAETTEGADYKFWLVNGPDALTTADACAAAGIDWTVAHLPDFRFDTARNMANALVPSDADVIIQLDADEVFAEPDWHTHIRSNFEGHRRWSYWLDSGDAPGWTRVKRANCHRNEAPFRWTHPVHEIVVGPPPTCHLDDLRIIHKPDKRKPRGYQLDMLKSWHDREPDDARLLFYLGREFAVQSNRGECRKHLQKYLDHPRSWAPERGEAMLLLGNISDDPASWYWKAAAEHHGRREPFCYLSRMHSNHGRWDLAASMVMQANARSDRGIYTTHRWTWDQPWCDHTRLVADRTRMDWFGLLCPPEHHQGECGCE